MKPPSWKTVELGDVCRELTVGHVGPMADKYVDAGVPFFRSQDIEPFRLKQSDHKFINADFDQKLKKSRLFPGDVVVVRTGYPGTACVVPENLTRANCADLVIIRPTDAIDPWFLTGVLNSAWGRSAVAGNLVGVAQQHFNVGAARSLQVSLPPIDQQRLIGGRIRAYCNLIENNTRRIAILEEMARRIFDEWFVHFRAPDCEGLSLIDSPLGPIPKGWAVGPLQNVIVLQRGFDLPTSSRSAGSYPVVAATGIHGNHCEFKVVGPGVVTGRSGSLGTVLHIDQKFWPLNTTLWGKEFPIGSTYYAYYTLSGIDLRSMNGGAAVPTLNRNDLHKHPVIIPPENLVDEFDKLIAPFFKLKNSLVAQTVNLRAQRDLLLPKLISGEIELSAAKDFKEAAE
jgi:type I restriction enzyme S subunit